MRSKRLNIYKDKLILVLVKIDLSGPMFYSRCDNYLSKLMDLTIVKIMVTFHDLQTIFITHEYDLMSAG